MAVFNYHTHSMRDRITLSMMFPTSHYIRGPDRVLAQIDILSGNTYYYIYNGHGDVVQIVDTSGNIVNSYDYDVWGNFLKKEETIENHFTYFGQTYDEETGLYYLRARYYDPTTGRFTQQDPAEDGYNWYVYGNQNPIVFTDYTGEAGETIFDILSFAISAKEVWDDPKDGWKWLSLLGDTVDFIPFVAGVGETVKAVRVVDKTTDAVADVTKLTTKEITAIAKKLGFEKTSYFSHGQAVFKKGNKYITIDVDKHNGGFWKMANSVEGLGSKKTRLGTYDINLNRIGD